MAITTERSCVAPRPLLRCQLDARMSPRGWLLENSPAFVKFTTSRASAAICSWIPPRTWGVDHALSVPAVGAVSPSTASSPTAVSASYFPGSISAASPSFWNTTCHCRPSSPHSDWTSSTFGVNFHCRAVRAASDAATRTVRHRQP